MRTPDGLKIEVENIDDYTVRVKVMVGSRVVAHTAAAPVGRAAAELGAILWELMMSGE